MNRLDLFELEDGARMRDERAAYRQSGREPNVARVAHAVDDDDQLVQDRDADRSPISDKSDRRP